MKQPLKRSRGFTLMEIVVVIAIMCFIGGSLMSAFTSVSSAKHMDRGAYDLAEILEFARNEAVARQTYVWVGIKQVETNSGLEIQVGAVYAKDGTGSNTSQNNLMGLGKILHIPNASLKGWTDLKEPTRALFPTSSPTSLASNANGIAFTVAQTRFENTTLTFSPRGEAMLKGLTTSDDGFDPLIDISFRQAHGKVVRNDADDVSVWVDGATAFVKIVCLQ